MKQNTSISDRIKILRKELKLNQKEFSHAIGIRQSTLSSYETGTITPSSDVLLEIAKKFNVSMDWLFGLSDNKIKISTISDIINILFQINESNELHFEFDVNNKKIDESSSTDNKWYAGIRFYGHDAEHPMNADICNFISSFQENRESLESYFTSKEVFEIWKQQSLDYYKSLPLTHKEIEELDYETRIQKRDELLDKKFSKKEEK